MTEQAQSAPPPPRRRQPLRIALFGVGAFMLVLVATTAAVVASFDPNSLKPRIREAVHQATGRELALHGDIAVKLSLWPTIAARDVTLANPPGFSHSNMATLRGMELRLGLIPLLSRRIEIERLVLIDPDIRLEINAAGQGNWTIAPVGTATQPSPAEAAGPKPDGAGRGLFAHVGELRIEGGRLAWLDVRSGQAHTIVIESLSAAATSAVAPVALDARLLVNDVVVTVQGETGPISRLISGGSGAPFPVAMTVTAASASMSLRGAIADPLKARGYDVSIETSIPDTVPLRPLLPDIVIPRAQDVTLSFHAQDQGSAMPVLSHVSLRTGSIALPTAAKGFQLDKLDLSAPSVDQPIAVTLVGRRGGVPVGATGLIGHPGLDLASVPPLPVDLMLTAADASLTVKGRVEKPLALSGVALDVVALVPDLAALSPLVDRKLPALKSIEFRGLVGEADGRLSNGIVIRDLRLRVPEADMGGELSLLWTAKPSVTAHLRSDRVDADSLRLAIAQTDSNLMEQPAAVTGGPPVMPGAPAAVTAPPRGARPKWLIPDRPIRFERLRTLDADIRLSIGMLRWVKTDYQAILAHLLIHDGRLRLDPFAAQVPEGRVTGSLTADAAQVVPRVHLIAHAQELALGSVLTAIGMRPMANGPLELLADVRGSGDTPRAIAASLSGSIGVAMAGGTLDTRMLGSSLGSLTRDLAVLDLLGRGGGVADIRCVALRFDAQDGIARSRTLLLSSSLLTADGSGTANLRDETLDLVLRPQGRMGGTGFRVPVRVVGPMRALKVDIDATGQSEPGGDKLAGIIIGAAALLGGLLGADQRASGGSPCPAALSIARGATAAETTEQAAPAASMSRGAASPGPPVRSPLELPNPGRPLQQLFR